MPGIPQATVGEIDYERLQALREESVALRRNKDTTKHYRADFKEGDKIILQDAITKKWDQKGTIVSARDCDMPEASRSYLIDVGQPQLKLRNRRFIRVSCRRVQSAESSYNTQQLGERRVRFIDEQ